MSCTHPLLAVNLRLTPEEEKLGKKKVKILTRIDEVSTIDQVLKRYQKFGDSLMLLPCGKCDACRLKYRREWSIRCEMESKYHKENCFVTLTYDNLHLPPTLIKSHYQKFIKNLRNLGYKVRYFGCGEYGSINHRPHWHLVLFGYFPKDVKYLGKSNSGFPQFTSKELDQCWNNKGFVTISEFAPETAGYVAGYVSKKMKVDDFYDDDVPSFIFMSTKPGIGRAYVEDHLGEIYKYDSLVVSFGSHKFGVPRYFDKVAQDLGLYIDDIKEMRVAASRIGNAYDLRDHNFQFLEDLFDYNAFVYRDKLQKKVRKL